MTANLALAKGIAEDWVTADPRNAAATSALANVLMLQGDIAGADARMRRMTTTAFAGNNAELRLRMDIAIKLGRADEARAWFDSLVKAIPDAPNINTQRGSLELAFGRAGRFVAGLTTHPFYRTGPAGAAYVRAIPRMLMGLPVTNLGELERDFYASITDTTNCDPGCRHERLAFSQQQALGQARTVLLDYGTPEKPHGSRAGRALARRDTAWLRHLATDYDTAARNDIVRLWPDGGGSAIAAEMYLALGDSAKALKTLRFAIDTAMMVMPGPSLLRFGVVQQSVWTGTMLHRAQLADAFGLKDEARKWYDRVLDLWAKADAEFQPDIARIRAARARLDGPVP
jgi:tetratricopeptide (TPR) repeat protein